MQIDCTNTVVLCTTAVPPVLIVAVRSACEHDKLKMLKASYDRTKVEKEF